MAREREKWLVMNTMAGVPLDIEKVKRLREAAGLTLAEAASRAGMGTRQNWHGIESGARPDPSISTVQRIAGVLGVTVDDLLLPLDNGPAGK